MKPYINILEKFREKVFIARLRARDADAFKEVYEFYLDRIYRYIFFKVSTRETAQDLTSEVFLRAWQYIYNNKGIIENLNAFLYQIARNAVIDFYRSKTRMEIGLEEEMIKIEDPSQRKIYSHIHAKMDLEEIEKALRSCKDEYRDVVILKYIEQLNDGEIAKIMNRSKGAVRVLLHRAMNALREKFQHFNHEKS